jgi:hypothetical protein
MALIWGSLSHTLFKNVFLNHHLVDVLNDLEAVYLDLLSLPRILTIFKTCARNITVIKCLKSLAIITHLLITSKIQKSRHSWPLSMYLPRRLWWVRTAMEMMKKRAIKKTHAMTMTMMTTIFMTFFPWLGL